MAVPQGLPVSVTEDVTENKGRQDGSQKSGHHVQQELHHRHHLLPEGCPAPFLQKNPAPFKPPPENPPKTPPAGRKPVFRPVVPGCGVSCRTGRS